MKKVSCKDIKPDSTCTFEATGETSKEVAGKMLDHIKKDHADDVSGMDNAGVRNMIEAQIHE